jgi:hypothetical protein
MRVMLASVLLALSACGTASPGVRLDAGFTPDASLQTDASTRFDAAFARDASLRDSGAIHSDAAAPGADASADTDGAVDAQVSCVPATRPGEHVLVGCATKVVLLDAGGGFRPAPPTGSECSGGASYTLVLATRMLDWSRCMQGTSATTPWKLQTGSTQVSVADFDTVMQALHGVTVASGSPCGADKSFESMTVTTPRGNYPYTDSFYSCQGQGKIYVDNIDAAFTALAAVAH